MRSRIAVFLILLISGFWVMLAEAKIGRGGGGGMRSGMGNRSAGISRGNINRGNVNRGNVNRGNVNRGNVNRGNINRSNINRDVNRNVNRDIDRDIDIDGGWGRGFFYDDPGWGWGSFAAGAAAGAVGAAIAHDDDDDVVIMPSTGGYVATLPSNCDAISEGGTTLYDCNGVYYQPTYQGASLMYQVVQP